MSEALIGLHVFTGADSTSAVFGKGKARSFQLFESSIAYQDVFLELGSDFNLTREVADGLERFVCELYNTSLSSVNEARYSLFCSKAFCDQRLPQRIKLSCNTQKGPTIRLQ